MLAYNHYQFTSVIIRESIFRCTRTNITLSDFTKRRHKRLNILLRGTQGQVVNVHAIGRPVSRAHNSAIWLADRDFKCHVYTFNIIYPLTMH